MPPTHFGQFTFRPLFAEGVSDHGDRIEKSGPIGECLPISPYSF